MDKKALVAGCRDLISLLDSPELGLASWHEACAEAAERIRVSFLPAREQPAKAGEGPTFIGR